MAGKYGGYRKPSGRKYAPRRNRGGFKPRYRGLTKSRYDDDAWVKVEKTVDMICDAQGFFWSGARTDNATSTGGTDISFLDQPEYQAFSAQNTYQLVEVRGIRADVTLAQHVGQTDRLIANCTIYAGPARGIPIGAVPNGIRMKGLPLQQVVNLQGQMSSLYCPVSNGLKSAGLPLSVQHNAPYPAENGYAIYVLGVTGGFAANALIGSVKFTYYVRLHQRKYLG